MRIRTVMSAVALGATVLALAAAGACARSSASPGIATAGGGGSASAHPSASIDRQEQAREFAQCMRDHGVDIPDPDTSAGPGAGSVRIAGSGGPVGGVDDAMGACKDKLPDGGAPPSLDPQQQAAMRAFAQCMRDHGVDMPDPDPNGGPMVIGGSGGPNLTPEDPTLQAAQKACQGNLPGAVTQQGGGSDTGPGFSVNGGGQ